MSNEYETYGTCLGECQTWRMQWKEIEAFEPTIDAHEHSFSIANASSHGIRWFDSVSDHCELYLRGNGDIDVVIGQKGHDDPGHIRIQPRHHDDLLDACDPHVQRLILRGIV